MKAGNIKGALLEYIVRNVLKNCGFSNVRADNIYSFERNGLLFIHGKGAAHDADIIMNPPIQMPFAYPTQLLFECKAHGGPANLHFIRNAIGLRHDLNEFEIVTRETLRRRQNNRRAAYAIDTRARYLYQVGVASVNDFSKPAIECAANNKIPLLSLSWFLSEDIIIKINNINQTLINTFSNESIKNLYDFFKDRDAELWQEKYSAARGILKTDNIFADIITFSNDVNRYAYFGLLETGDMIFLFAKTRSEDNILNIQNHGRFTTFKAKIHWSSNGPNVWTLAVYHRNGDQETKFDFFVPNRIFQQWQQFNLDRSVALDIKQEFFSKIFVFNQRYNPETPFSIINIDKKWLQRARIVNRE